MIVSRKALQKIKKIIERNYNSLLINTVTPKALSEEDLADLASAGYKIPERSKSLLEMIYYNNVLNELRSQVSPKTITEMERQQKTVPEGEIHTTAIEHINDSYSHALENLKATTQSRIEGLIRENNMLYRANVLQNLDRPENVAQLIKESNVGGIKQALRDYTKDANRNWERVAITETSNAMGLGSADRILMMNPDKSMEEVYVYRIPVNDAALCKHCRKFYLDSDQSPAVYRMSSLLGNGSNYGKKVAEWKPVLGATHPQDRESGVIEVRPGWKILPEGKLDFIGLEAWNKYILEKVRA